MSERWKKALGIGLEDNWGVPVAPTAFVTYFGKDTLKMDRQHLTDLDGTQETRDKVADVGGDITCEGEIPDIEVVADVVGLLLEGAFGDVDAGVYTAVDGALPSLTIEKIVGGTVNEQYMGMKIQELSMAAKARETLKMSVSLVGKQRFEIVSPTARDYSVKNPFVFYQGTFKIDDVEVLIREFNITLNNNIKHPNHQSGDIYTQEQYEGIRDVTGSVLLDFKTLTMRNKFMNITEASVEYLFTNGSDSLKIEMPKVVFPSWSLEEDEQIYLQRVDFRGLRDGSDAAIKATLVSA